MKKLGKLFTVLMFVFLYAPLIIMVIFSFNAGSSTTVMSGFSFKWYQELLHDRQTITALENTLILAVLSSVLATVLGTVAAVGIDKMRSRKLRSGVMTVTNIPMMSPEIVTGVSMMLLFVLVGTLVNASGSLNFFTILIAHITFNLPYVILNVLPKLKKVDVHLSEAAEDLGCTPSMAFRKVVLPSIIPGIFSGFIMAFTLSLDDFVISLFTSGPDFQTLPIRIFSMTKKSVKPDMYALSSIIFLVVLVLLILSNLTQSDTLRRTHLRRRVMKIVSFAVVGAIGLSLAAVSVISHNMGDLDLNLEGTYTRALEGTTLNVYNWGEYISDGGEDSLDVNAAFEELTGIKVNYVTFESNEDMYGIISSGAVPYDIIIPSDYMIDRLIKEDRLMKIDFSAIDNYHYIAEQYRDLSFDPTGEYCVPYTVGLVGLIYNTTLVDEVPDSWSIMWDEKYAGQILNFNNPRDAFAIAQFLLGIDVNTTDLSQWDAAAELLMEQRPVLQAYVMDEIYNKMEGGNAAIAPYYAGDFYTMYEANEDLAMVYPKEGTNIFIDAMCIPKTCQNYEAALMYINFLMEPDVALANAEYICYASPHTAVIENEEYSFYQDEILYPPEEDMPYCQYFNHVDQEITNYYGKLWERITLGQ